MSKPLPALVDADYSSLCRWAGDSQPTLTADGSGFCIHLAVGRLELTALYRGTAPGVEDGVPDEDTRLSCEITVDGRPVATPERWSGIVALVREHTN